MEHKTKLIKMHEEIKWNYSDIKKSIAHAKIKS